MTTQRPPLARFKIERAITKVIDAKAGRIHAIVSTESKDRQGDIIRQAHWNLDAFQAHPVLLSSHDYGSLRSQIGEWEDMGVIRKRLEGVAHYYIGEGNQEADWAFNLAVKGRAAYSVGFLPDMSKAVDLGGGEDAWFGGPWEYKGQELLEVSHVTVPANPEALQRMKSLQGLHPVMAQVVDEALEEARAAGLTKDAHGDMGDMKDRMEAMAGEMSKMASMMADMMDEMKGLKGRLLTEDEIVEVVTRTLRPGLSTATREGIHQGLREALLRC